MKKFIQFSLAALVAVGMALTASAQWAKENPPPREASGFSDTLRETIRSLTEGEVRAALEDAKAKGFLPGDHAIVITPIFGDRDNFVRNRLKNALTGAGLVCVEASNDMWTNILTEIEFNWNFRDMLDESHMASIYERRLLPSEVLLYGGILISHGQPGTKRAPGVPPKVELALHADDLRTRRHIWGRDFVGAPPLPPPPPSKMGLVLNVTVPPPMPQDREQQIVNIMRSSVGSRTVQVQKTENTVAFNVDLDLSPGSQEANQIIQSLNVELQKIGLAGYWLEFRRPDSDERHPVFLPAQTAPADLAVFVSARPQDGESEDLALELLSIARETVGGQGFQVAFEADKADVAVQLSVRKTVFDRTGEYAVMEGSVRAIATSPARKGYYLGETRIDRERGERVLGDHGAMLSVRDGIEPKLVSWLGQNVTVEKTGIAAVTIPCDISMLEDENAVAKFVHDFCAEAVKIDGVARCALVSQTEDDATFYFAYITDKLPEGPVNALRARHPELFPVQEPEY